MAVYTKEVANITDEDIPEFKELFKKQLMLGDSE
jgi:hypothetical protein